MPSKDCCTSPIAWILEKNGNFHYNTLPPVVNPIPASPRDRKREIWNTPHKPHCWDGFLHFRGLFLSAGTWIMPSERLTNPYWSQVRPASWVTLVLRLQLVRFHLTWLVTVILRLLPLRPVTAWQLHTAVFSCVMRVIVGCVSFLRACWRDYRWVC